MAIISEAINMINNENTDSKATKIMREALANLISEQLETDCEMSLDEAYKLALRDMKIYRKQLKSEQSNILAKARYSLYNL